jgi:hypothetical protein
VVYYFTGNMTQERSKMKIKCDKFETDGTAANMNEDKLKAVELGMAAMDINLENIEAKMGEIGPRDQDGSRGQEDKSFSGSEYQEDDDDEEEDSEGEDDNGQECDNEGDGNDDDDNNGEDNNGEDCDDDGGCDNDDDGDDYDDYDDCDGDDYEDDSDY